MSNKEKAGFDDKINEQLVLRIKAGEDTADNMLLLWQQNRRFVVKMAMKYQGYAELDDLVQEGYIGLCEAVSHFQTERGVSFISYAAFWIQQAMRRYVDNCCSAVRIPVHAREWIYKFRKAASEYQKYYGIEPSDVALRHLLKVDQKKLQEIKKSVRAEQVQSLDAPIESQDLTLAEMVASDQDIESDIEKELDTAAMRRALWIAVDNLPDNLPEVIKRRFLNGQTLDEISKEWGVTYNKVRQIQDKALRTLRQPRLARRYRRYYEDYISSSSSSYHHVGVESFQRTWTSEVEREALRL